MKIRGSRVFLTGASSGLGAAMALELAQRGASCVLASRHTELLRVRSRQIETRYPDDRPPRVVHCDVTSCESVARAMLFAVDALGGIDLLINNAGISAYGDMDKTDSADIQELMNVNFLGCVHGMREVLPHMRHQGGGHIVNIASLAALHGVPYLAAYGASKAALAAYSQSARAELASQGIQVQVVYPGYTQTPIFQHEKKLGGARRPTPPYQSAEDVAASILDAVERGESETILTLRGKTMSALRGTLPGLLDRFMARLAARLQEKDLSSDG